MKKRYREIGETGKVIRLIILLIFEGYISGYSQGIEFSKPTINGNIKTKLEYATETGMTRFSVRNSRALLSGTISDIVLYKGQIELSDEGEFRVLDLNASIRFFDGLTVTLGQTSLPFFNSYAINPGDLMFSNRPFLGKYFTPTRDIGILGTYRSGWDNFPVSVEFGVFNGSTINNPIWTDKPSYATRIQLGGMTGFRTTAKFYRYPLSDQQDYTFWGVDARYAGSNYNIETEVMHRYNDFDGVNRISLYVQGSYTFPVRNPGIIKSVTPALRWDSIGENLGNGMFDNNRATFGVAFGLTEKPFKSLFRINYEHYMVNNAIPEFLERREIASDKLTFEILVVF